MRIHPHPVRIFCLAVHQILLIHMYCVGFSDSLRWQPPEIMGGRSLMTEHADVYAYAMTCVEVVTFGNWPWPGLSDDQVRDAVLSEYACASLLECISTHLVSI